MRPSSSPTPYSNPLPEQASSSPPRYQPHHRAVPPSKQQHSHFANMMHSAAGSGGNGMFGITGSNALNSNNSPILPSAFNSRHGQNTTPHQAMFNSNAAAAAGPHGGGRNAAGGGGGLGLRPLPQAVKQTGLLGMMIQGHSAGEGRQLAPTEVRVAQDRKSSTALDTGINKEARDSAKIRKLETEIEKLKELLKKRTGERDKANTRVEELEKQLAEANKKAAELDASSKAALLDKSQAILNLQVQVKQLEEKLAKQAADHEKANRSQQGKAGEELDTLRNLLAKEKKDREESEAQLKKDMADLQKRLDESNDKKRRNSSDLQSQIDRLTAELAGKTRECSSWEDKASKYQKELKSQEASFAEWKARIEATNEYILKICQPQFSVVKDESLAPVTPNGEGQQEGYVLVPLPLMLQGYGLLPQELKRKIASEYEANKKSLSAALPRRASQA